MRLDWILMDDQINSFDNFGSNPPSEKFLAWKMWISRKITTIMDENKFSTGMLSLLSGLPEEYIVKITNAEISPSNIALVKISIALSVPRNHFDPPEDLVNE